ncbi:AbiV family abortive infection protein [Ascidiimonas sp. W6]|uniref:AbiV family abortive infection protein n=1 Tax=Ascidiimonas meishanensis TaxID=3128903 RepID=UPI0030EDF2DB
MREKLSKYKFKKIATESFKNGIRLHFDSVLLHKNKSFASAFQLSVLALEEFSKSQWVEHYYDASITNSGFPDKDFEQKWLNLLYFHPRKQKAFFGWGISRDYSEKFMKFVEDGGLELKKQKATYVGLEKNRRKVNVNSRISLPSQIKSSDSKQMISLINDFLIDRCDMKSFHEVHFCIPEKDELLNDSLYKKLGEWKHKSGLRKYPLFKTRLKNSR